MSCKSTKSIISLTRTMKLFLVSCIGEGHGGLYKAPRKEEESKTKRRER